MDFLILNRHQVSTLSPELPHIVISITEPKSEFPKIRGLENSDPNFLGCLRLVFTDEDNPDKTLSPKEYLFTEEQAEQIIQFVFDMKERTKVIICQCDGGISRSSGTAAALSVILNGPRTDKWIFDHPGYVPNIFVYRTLLDTYFGSYNNK